MAIEMADQVNRVWLGIAGLSGAFAVMAGAFGAHGLESAIPPRDLAAFKTGAHYHLIHSLALAAIAVLYSVRPRLMALAAWSFLIGVILFAGSLYVLGVTGSRALVLLTPLGGLCFILGWVLMAYAGFIQRKA